MSDMKLIMDSWRVYTENIDCSESQVLTEEIQAKDYVHKIKLGLTLLAAKAAGKSALKSAVTELGPDIVDAGLEWVKAIPIAGNAVASLTALWKTGKTTAKAVLASGLAAKAAFDVLKLAATDYVGMDDNKIGQNPLAKLFNIDDRMETPIAEDFLNNFAGLLLRHLQDSPDTYIPNPDEFAENALANYMRAKGYFGDVEPPR